MMSAQVTCLHGVRTASEPQRNRDNTPLMVQEDMVFSPLPALVRGFPQEAMLDLELPLRCHHELAKTRFFSTLWFRLQVDIHPPLQMRLIAFQQRRAASI